MANFTFNFFFTLYYIWRNAGIQTRDAATGSQEFYTNELLYTHIPVHFTFTDLRRSCSLTISLSASRSLSLSWNWPSTAAVSCCCCWPRAFSRWPVLILFFICWNRFCPPKVVAYVRLLTIAHSCGVVFPFHPRTFRVIEYTFMLYIYLFAIKLNY